MKWNISQPQEPFLQKKSQQQEINGPLNSPGSEAIQAKVLAAGPLCRYSKPTKLRKSSS